MAKNKIIIADDHPLVRVGLKELINRDPGLTVAGEAEDGQKLLELLSRAKCDLIVVDISMPRMDGLAAIKEIHKQYPGIKILVLSMLKDYQHFQQIMAHGAAGYMVKDDASDLLVSAIKMILKGKKYVSPSVTTMLVDRQLRAIEDGETPSLEILTQREKEILTMVAKGLANKNIASKLKISIRTVEHHRGHLTDKLGIKNTAALIRYALAKGLIQV